MKHIRSLLLLAQLSALHAADAPHAQLDEQVNALRPQEQCQLRMSRFYEAWALIKDLPLAGTPKHQVTLDTLARLRAEDEASPSPNQATE
jgi:hypothetical protein